MVMIIVGFGWLLLIPLLMLWRQKMRWEIKASYLQKEIEEFQKKELLIEQQNSEILNLKVQKSEIETLLKEKEKNHEERVKLLEETKEKLSLAFKAISFETLEAFHEKSEKEMVKKEELMHKMLDPVKQSLHKLDEGMRLIEKERKGESELFKEQLRAVLESEKSLRDETANLVNALRKPDVRGIWGELQLKRVVELAGMVNYCDFYEQQVIEKEEGARMRPDLIIRLPGDRTVVVDAKVPFESFLEANHTDDPNIKEAKLHDHARRLRQHMQQLGKKSYWEQFPRSPEFVILFLPAEIFFSAALQYDPTLIEVGAEQGVIIATPTTLIGLLKAIAYGWKQDTFSKHAEEISLLGHELYKRLGDMNRHLGLVGKSLNHAVEEFNRTVGSFERRVLVTARKFKQYGAASGEVELEPVEFIEKIPRQVADPTIEV